MATTRDWTEHLGNLIEVDSESGKKESKYAVVLLNHCFDTPALKFEINSAASLKLPKIQQFISLWNGACVRHTVDGGSNYLFDLQQLAVGKEGQQQLKDPDLLTGDLDSVRAEVLQHYKQNSNNVTAVIETPDQDYTDFTKAIQVLAKHIATQQTNVSTIIVFHTSSGRLDHSLSNFSTLYRFAKDIDSGSLPPLVLVDLASSISCLLSKGKHVIPAVKSANWCSLVPLNGPVRLNTTGFRWNLDGEQHQLEFGSFISTSQEFDGHSKVATVEVLTEKGLLFSVDYS